MAYTEFRTVQFGPDYVGLSHVGFTVKDSAGATVSARTETGVIVLVTGDPKYGAPVTFPTGYLRGFIVWDTGDLTGLTDADGNPLMAQAEVDPINLGISPDTANAISDADSNRDTGLATGGAASNRKKGEALYAIRNGFKFDPADPNREIVLDPYDADSWTRSVTSDPAALPVTRVGP